MSTASARNDADLLIEGMTCAACVRRIERAVGAVPGVQEVTVNLVTRRASVQFDPAATNREQVAAAIEKSGYSVVEEVSASPHRPDAAARAGNLADAEDREQRSIRRDVLFAAIFTVPLLLMAMSHGAIPGTSGLVGRLVQLVLATPIVFGPGRRFLRLALRAARHRSADMNTLVAIGVLSAWGYSTVAVVAPGWFPHAEHGARAAPLLRGGRRHRHVRAARQVARDPRTQAPVGRRPRAGLAGPCRPPAGCATASRRRSASRRWSPATRARPSRRAHARRRRGRARASRRSTSRC